MNMKRTNGESAPPPTQNHPMLVTPPRLVMVESTLRITVDLLRTMMSKPKTMAYPWDPFASPQSTPGTPWGSWDCPPRCGATHGNNRSRSWALAASCVTSCKHLETQPLRRNDTNTNNLPGARYQIAKTWSINQSSMIFRSRTLRSAEFYLDGDTDCLLNSLTSVTNFLQKKRKTLDKEMISLLRYFSCNC